MFRCFWNWLITPSDGQKVPSKSKQHRRNKQRKRVQAAVVKRKETERHMPREDIERNKELLKETFKRLNGFYRSREE